MDILNQEVTQHYLEGQEHERLLTPHGRLEFERSKDIILRNIFRKPARIADLGGGTGHYSFWLANLGYEVHMIDAMQSHIDYAKRFVESCTLASLSVGDARATRFGDESMDVVIMFGPLYHLVERGDRMRALEEAARILKPGGKLFAVCISKFASLIDGYSCGFMNDPDFETIVEQDLKDGQHRNPTNHPEYFTTTKFHSVKEFQSELSDSGFDDIKLYAVESFASQIPDLETYMTPEKKGKLFDHLRKIELDETILGVSPHIMGVCRKWLTPRVTVPIT